MKRTLFLLTFISLLASCGGKSSNSSSIDVSSGSGTPSITSISSLEEERTLYSLNFSDAKNGERYETSHDEWVFDISSSSYEGAIKLQYGRNSVQGRSNYILSPYKDFMGRIQVELDCYATINDSVIQTDPFELAVIGLDENNNEVEKDNITSVSEMPNPSFLESEVKTFTLTNIDNKIKRVKIELVTKLTSSNVGIKSLTLIGM